MRAVFLCAPMEAAALRRAVLGIEGCGAVRPAGLPGHALIWPRGLCTAVPVPRRGATAAGLVAELAPPARDRLGFWKAAQGLAPCEGALADGTAVEFWSRAPVAPGPVAPGPVAPGPGAALPAELCLAVAEEVMALWPSHDRAVVAGRWAMLAARGASRWRARQAGAEGLGAAAPDPAPEGGRVETLARSRPWEGFFAVETRRLRHALFAGGMSAALERAGFIMADAVTVLPYDPRRERVLAIEQFRFGPLLRDDPLPWSLEPVAGRIDLGESPEAAARREALEEAGVRIEALHPIGAYYSSPGAVSEFLFSYIGIADLPDGAARVCGLAEEHEDIRGRLLGLDELAALVAAGRLRNGPMLLSAVWLMQNRARLAGGGAGGA